MELQIKHTKSYRSGTDYLVITIPKKYLKKLPNGYFWVDVELKNILGGKYEL